jgi:hypothetical protein
MRLKLANIVRREKKHRSAGDRRKKVNYVLASYIGEDGREYRKSFESYGEPFIPAFGTNEEITNMKIQY